MIVFVHGNPETAELWDRVREHVEQPSLALSLPGFGVDRPRGFGATGDEYVAWLVAELEAVGEPVDLVGHDVGALFTCRVATTSDVRLRSWVADVANVLHPDYVWHDFAQVWQSPAGEEHFRRLLAAGPGFTAPAFEAFGVPADEAVRLASWLDERMAQSVLDLYRSATPNPYARWGDSWKRAAAPGLVLHPARDPFSHERMSREVAQALGAEHRVLPGLGHFWPLEAPEETAKVLTAFWRGVD